MDSKWNLKVNKRIVIRIIFQALFSLGQFSLGSLWSFFSVYTIYNYDRLEIRKSIYASNVYVAGLAFLIPGLEQYEHHSEKVTRTFKLKRWNFYYDPKNCGLQEQIYLHVLFIKGWGKIWQLKEILAGISWSLLSIAKE